MKVGWISFQCFLTKARTDKEREICAGIACNKKERLLGIMQHVRDRPYQRPHLPVHIGDNSRTDGET